MSDVEDGMGNFRVPVFCGRVTFVLFTYTQPPVLFLEDFANCAALHAKVGPDIFLPCVKIG